MLKTMSSRCEFNHRRSHFLYSLSTFAVCGLFTIIGDIRMTQCLVRLLLLLASPIHFVLHS